MKPSFIHTYKEIDSPYWVAAFSTTPMPADLTKEMSAWCYNTYGPGLGDCRIDNSPFIHRWVNDIRWGEVRFSDERDLTWFILRWSK